MLWYSVICVITILLVSPLKNASKWVRGFLFWLPKFILPLLIMMFVSVGIRINAYGITEGRYLVFGLGLWVLGVMMYLNLSGAKRYVVIPLSLAVLTVIASYGPLSGYSVSRYSQNCRLEAVLERNGMLDAQGRIVSKSAISGKDRKQILAILEYFEDEHDLKEVRSLPAGYNPKKAEAVFGFDLNDQAFYEETFFLTAKDRNINIITGYDYMISFAGNDLEQGALAVGGVSLHKNGDLIINYGTRPVKVLNVNRAVEQKLLNVKNMRVLLQADKPISLDEFRVFKDAGGLFIALRPKSITGAYNKKTGRITNLRVEGDILIGSTQ